MAQLGLEAHFKVDFVLGSSVLNRYIWLTTSPTAPSHGTLAEILEKMKRLFDITLSFVAIIVFLIPIILISFLLTFKEKHFIFFHQERVGLKKKRFDILKFQTLINEVPTQTGRILRKTGLDELPQFINVLKGDMSIVGPRALTMFDIDRLKWNGNFHQVRWNTKPGITGFAQIYGGQHRKTSWFWDKKYISKNNLLTDFIIISISFLMNLFGKKRVRQMIFKKNTLK